MAVKMETRDLNVWYGENHVLMDLNLKMLQNKVTAIIGPSGCGKTTFLRSLDRLIDLYPGARVEGAVLLDGEEVYDPDFDVVWLRKRVGMVFQRSNPLPKSIYENVAYGPRIHGVKDQERIGAIVEECLKTAKLWSEVDYRLGDSAFALSVGQQQRLCIARALAVEPDVLLMDEPCSALDPMTTAKIEELIRDLKEICTPVVVTHNMAQAARISDYVAFFYLGKLVEFGTVSKIFKDPDEKLTQAYIAGEFG